MLSALLQKQSSKTKADPKVVAELYYGVTALGRSPVFYQRFAVPDTTDGRYDLFCLSLSLTLFRIQYDYPEIAQAVFDLAFRDVERGLREVGVGDLSVSKHMKKMLEAFYGRASLYYEAIEQKDNAALAAVITRNLYNGQQNDEAFAMAEWVTILWTYMMHIDTAEFVKNPAQLLQLLPPEKEAA